MEEFNLSEVILEGTAYVSGFVNKDDDYTISASMIGKEPLENYLRIVNGTVPETALSDATLGTVFHRGMEGIMQDRAIADGDKSIVGIEKSMSHKLSNGWVLSGTADLIVKTAPGRYSIHDYKLTKNYTYKMLQKELHTHNYTKQLQVLDALFRVDGGAGEINNDIDLYIEMFLKDSKAVAFEPILRSVKAPNKVGTTDMNASEVLFTEVVQITDSLQAYIESGELPPKCTDVWPRNVKGTVIATKCALYCSYGKAGTCPHYNPDTRKEVNRLVNW